MNGAIAKVVLVVFLALAVLGTAWTHDAARRGMPAENKELIPVEYLPDPGRVKILSLGHQNAMADLFWIRGVLYFANEMHGRLGFDWLNEYIKIVIALDPKFIDIYKWGGMASVLRTEKVEWEHVEMANRILEMGAEQFPEDHEMLMSAASNCSFYVKDRTPELRVKLDACRKKYFGMAATRPNAPYFAAFMASDLDSDDPRICKLLTDTYLRQASDPKARKQLQYRLRDSNCSGLNKDQVLKFDEQFRTYKTKIPSFSYLPDDLYTHVEVFPSEEKELEDIFFQKNDETRSDIDDK